MRAERERLNAKIVAENLRLGAEARELTSEEELCYLIPVSYTHLTLPTNSRV